MVNSVTSIAFGGSFNIVGLIRHLSKMRRIISKVTSIEAVGEVFATDGEDFLAAGVGAPEPSNSNICLKIAATAGFMQ